MKRFAFAIMAMVIISLTVSGCKNGVATFSNSDGTFDLSSNGTYTQTFPQADSRSDKKKKDNPFDDLPNSGSWRLIGPSDGPGNSGFTVELSGVQRCNNRSLADSYTLDVGAGSIRGFDNLLGKQKSNSPVSAP